MRNPFTTRYDVAIFGAGLSGIAAALTLADHGQQVLLVERRPNIAWEVTTAFQCGFAGGDEPVTRFMRKRISAMHGLRADRLDIPTTEIALDRMLERAGIDLLLYAQPMDVRASADTVTGIVIGSKGGEQLISADAYLDATDEGVLMGGAPAPACGRYSLFFHNVQVETLPARIDDCGELSDITCHGSVRDGELCVEYTVLECSATTARLTLERIMRHLRSQTPLLANAGMTHVSLEPFPIYHAAANAPACHPTWRNLFAAGPCTGETPANTLLARAELGERIAQHITAKTFDQTAAAPLLPQGEPMTTTVDVIVAGGGTAGVIAAIAAARQGAKVVLLEHHTLLGGIMSGGGMHFHGHGVPGGLQEEYYRRCAEITPRFNGNALFAYDHADGCKYVLEQMAREAGVDVRYGVIAVGAEMDGNRITGVYAATPHGKRLFRAEVVIDSTGDGDVAAMAGAQFYLGRESDGVLHCYSQCTEMLSSEQVWDENGNARCVTHMTPVNADAGYVDPFDIVDLTRAKRQGIRGMWERWAKGFWGEKPLAYFCPILGLRQGRVIIGDYLKDFHEQVHDATYDDCISYERAKYDCHSQDYANQQDLPVLWVWLLGNRERRIGGQTPYRCLLPRGIEGLLIACRAASMTNEAQYQFRTIRNMMRIGEAAGIAAAFSVQRHVTPRALDVRLVQEALQQSGALGEAAAPPPIVQPYTFAEQQAMLASNDPKDAVFLLAHGGQDAVDFLCDFVRTGPPASRFWGAVALAWHRHEAALPELLNYVSERIAENPSYNPRSKNMVPLWQSAIVLLGRIGSPAAVPALLDVLRDDESSLDALIAATRALGRIGDTSVVPDLLALLQRDDLPRDRTLQVTSLHGKWPAREDGLWQIELAIAEILATFGHPQPQVLERYRTDERNHVRRYALRMGEIGNTLDRERGRR